MVNHFDKLMELVKGKVDEHEHEADIKREESNRIAVKLSETLTWDKVADHMKGYGFDPHDCQLGDVMLSVRKLMRQVVQVVEDDEDYLEDGICVQCGVDWRTCDCPVCGTLHKGHGEL